MKAVSSVLGSSRASAFAGAYKLPSAFGIRDNAVQNSFNSFGDSLTEKLRTKQPVKVAVTGAAGAIGYAALFRIANGELLGPDQPVEITGVELPFAMDALRGVEMELEDCAFPLVTKFTGTDDPDKGFANADIALLIGSKPRGPGMERSDLIRENGQIFQKLGQSLNRTASRDVRVTVVGNPCNTNAYIAMQNAPDLKSENFTAMTRLDHDRALGIIAAKTQLPSNIINFLGIWGNHSPTMFPDLSHTLVNGAPILELIGEYRFKRWWQHELIPKVQERGARIIEARGASSAASAANACIAHTRDWCLGTALPDWTSMAYPSDGQYNVPEGLVFSFPTICQNGTYATATYPASDRRRLTNGPFHFSMTPYYIEQNVKELLQERDFVADLLPN